MKKIIIISIIAACCNSQLFAQVNSRITGIFKTKEAFKKNQAAYLIPNENDKKNKIYLNDLLKSKYVLIKNDSGITKILKDSIYGFQKSDYSMYRLQNKRAYKLLDTSTSVLVYHVNVPQVPTGKVNATAYCYSFGDDDTIKKLTIANLLKDFENNEALCTAIKTNFKFNSELVEIDDCTKEFKIVTLLKNYTKVD